MSAGLPLLILSFLSTIILVVWSRNGSGQRNFRVLATATIVLSLVASWATLLAFGVFHPVGSWGMALGFIISIGAFLCPLFTIGLAAMKTHNKLLLSPLRGGDGLHAASLCFGRPKARRYE